MSVSPPPIITFTTDFGTSDFYAAAMKGAALRLCPQATLVDVTHAVPRHDIVFGAIMLERAIAGFPDGTIHVAVVDPGVGTARRILLAQWKWQTVICPDNGLITWGARRHGMPELYELTWRPPAHSEVFHGRDIMAPAAAMLAAGSPITAIARTTSDAIMLDITPTADLRHGGQIIHIDHFGNVTTNIPAELFTAAPNAHVVIRNLDVGAIRRTYQDVAPGTPLTLIGSSGLLEIAVREGSAAATLGIHVGDRVELTQFRSQI